MRVRSRNILKVAILGNGGVGKTTFTKRCVKNIFDPKTEMTIGIEFHLLRTQILDPLTKEDEDPQLIDLEIQIWDFGGEERFRFMLPRYCKGAVGGLLLYDSTRLNTAKNLEEWLGIWKDNAPDGAPIFLVATKRDLLSNETIDQAIENGQEKAEDLGLPEFELISSKTGDKIDLILNTLLTEAYLFNHQQIEGEQ